MGRYLDEIKKRDIPPTLTDKTDRRVKKAKKKACVSFVSAPHRDIQKNTPSVTSAFYYRLNDDPGTELTMIAPGLGLDHVRKILADKFGANRILSVRARKADAS